MADARIFAEMNRGIRDRCDVIIQKHHGRTGLPIAERITSLDAKPEIGLAQHGLGRLFPSG